MSELAKEKLYRKELIKVGATGNNNLERIRSLSGGGGDLISLSLKTYTGTIFDKSTSDFQENVVVNNDNKTITGTLSYSDFVEVFENPFDRYGYYMCLELEFNQEGISYEAKIGNTEVATDNNLILIPLHWSVSQTLTITITKYDSSTSYTQIREFTYTIQPTLNDMPEEEEIPQENINALVGKKFSIEALNNLLEAKQFGDFIYAPFNVYNFGLGNSVIFISANRTTFDVGIWTFNNVPLDSFNMEQYETLEQISENSYLIETVTTDLQYLILHFNEVETGKELIIPITLVEFNNLFIEE